MKIGIFTDVHSNVVALNTVLDFFGNESCNEIICCGDIIGIGPFPEETVQRIMSVRNIKCVLGNHDLYLKYGLNTFSNNMDIDEAEHHLWVHSSLSLESKKYISRLPFILEFEYEGIKITAVHYSINENNEYADLIPSPTQEDCKRMFSTIESDIICYGHNHNVSIVIGDNAAYINCSSLGCPANGIGMANCGILTIEKGNFNYCQVQLEYDLQKVINKIEELHYPDYKLIENAFYGIE